MCRLATLLLLAARRSPGWAWVFAACMAWVLPAGAETVVVVASSSSVSTLSAEQVSDLFLGKTGRFPDGAGPVQTFDLSEGSVAREQFYRRLTGRDTAQMTAYRARMMFTGRGQPPIELARDELVRRAVAGNPLALGYLERNAVDASLRIVLVLH